MGSGNGARTCVVLCHLCVYILKLVKATRLRIDSNSILEFSCVVIIIIIVIVYENLTQCNARALHHIEPS